MTFLRNYFIYRDMVAKNTQIQSYMELPTISRIILASSTKKTLENVHNILDSFHAAILCTGQKPICTRAKKSLARYRLRRGQISGYKVTLRRHSIPNFLLLCVSSVLPNLQEESFPKKKKIHTHSLKKNTVHYSFGLPGGFMGFPQSDEFYDLFESCSGFTVQLSFSCKKTLTPTQLSTKFSTHLHLEDSSFQQKQTAVNYMRAYGFPFSTPKP